MKRQKPIKKPKIILILSTFITLIILALSFQDFLLSKLFNQTYSFPESMLFKIQLIIFFIPILFYRPFVTKKINMQINMPKILLFLIPLSIIHMLLSSWTISLVSQYFMELPVIFLMLLKDKFTQDFIFIITVYFLLFLIARYYWIKNN